MYEAKGERASHIFLQCVRIRDGMLVEIADGERPDLEPPTEP